MSMDIETAIEWQKTFKSGFLGITDEACDFTIAALKELQQYRQIGTVDECRSARDELIELQEYHKLGTVKELWAERKKQTPMHYHHTRINEELVKTRDTVCPVCLGVTRTALNEFPNYCSNCGHCF